MNCPLCKSNNISLIEEINIDDIQAIYWRNLRINIANNLASVKQINYSNCNDCDLFFFDPLVTGDQQFYNDMQQYEWYYPEQKNEFLFAADSISINDSVLEVGSGKGAFAKLIKAKNYVGLEFSKNAVEMAKSNGIKVINESVQEHAVNNSGKYDVVCSFQVLEHVADVYDFLNALISCLKPGGKLILSVPSYDSFSRHVSNFELDMPPHHVTRWTDQALGNIAKVFSLKVNNIWHEPMQPVHKDFYVNTVSFNSINHYFLKRQRRVVDNSWLARVVHKISRQVGRFFATGITDELLLPRGISVTAVFSKPAAKP